MQRYNCLRTHQNYPAQITIILIFIDLRQYLLSENRGHAKGLQQFFTIRPTVCPSVRLREADARRKSVEPDFRNDHGADGRIQFLHQFRLHHAEVCTQGRVLYLHEQGLVPDKLPLRVPCHGSSRHGVPGIDKPLLQQRGFQSALSQKLIEYVSQRLHFPSEHDPQSSR